MSCEWELSDIAISYKGYKGALANETAAIVSGFLSFLLEENAGFGNTLRYIHCGYKRIFYSDDGIC